MKIPVSRSAEVSTDGLYRYELTRSWTPAFEGRHLCWIMLNPSTADAEQDDPTIRRCCRFAQSWGYGGIVVVNLFALRVTRPIHLSDHPDPVGPENDKRAGFWIRHLPCIAAWGAHPLAATRLEWLDRQVRMGSSLRCLGVTREGHPRHPLYVKATAQLQPYEIDMAAA